MKIVRDLILALCLLTLIVCSWIAPMDAPATTEVDAGLRRALITFASARAISGIISVVQAAQVDIQPAGVGVTLSPGQFLAPANELVKHFADLMLLACIAFGLQKALILISGYWLISAMLTTVAVAWAGIRIQRKQAPSMLSKTLVLMLMLRFAIPIAVLTTEILSQKFLLRDYASAQKSIDTTAIDTARVKPSLAAPNNGKWWMPNLPNWMPNIPNITGEYDKIKQALENSTEQIVKLMVFFLASNSPAPVVDDLGFVCAAEGHC